MPPKEAAADDSAITLNSPDVDAEILKDWEAIQARGNDGGEDEPAGEQPQAGSQQPQEGAEPPQQPQRPRDQRTGQFKEGKSQPVKPGARAAAPAAPAAQAAPQPQDGQQPGAQPPADGQQQIQDGQQPDGQPRARDVSRPPSTWRPGARADWANLPQAVREEIHRREGDYMNGQQQLLPDARLGSSMRQVIEPYRMMIEAEGGNPAAAVGDLLRTAAILRMGSPEQKIGAIGRIAQQFGIDLRPLIQPLADGQPPEAGQQPGAAPGSQPPNPAQFRDPRVDALLQHQQQEQLQRQQADAESRTSAAMQWMNEVDGQGNPLRPYVNDVMTEMRAMVPQIRHDEPGLSHAQVLQKAYDRAIWAHPEIRTLLLQQQQQEQQQRRTTENQQRIAEVRRSTSVNVPRRASTPAPAKPGRLEDTITETARELGLLG